MEFYKYQGTGNDFVMVDNRAGGFNDARENVAFLCHRRFGIGADGLILIENEAGFDFKMRYFNADGGEGSMCGNGGRCAVQFAADLGIFKENTRFLAVDGPHSAQISHEGVSLHMKDVHSVEDCQEGFFLDTGSPHLILFTDELSTLDVKSLGAALRYGEYWKPRGGVNVNFVQVLDPHTIKVRTYERGVEDETYSCGTGVTAASIVSHLKKGTEKKVKVITLGGELQVSLEPGGLISNILLSGPAEKVFKGSR
jgi:diaminopimelate epimerase